MSRHDVAGNQGGFPDSGEPLIDTLSKALARPSSRGSFLKMLAGGLAVGMLGATPLARTALAATTSVPPYCPSCAPCIAYNLDTSTGALTSSSCPSTCPGTALCAKSSVNTSYKTLLAYLDSLGLQPTKQPAPNQTKRNVQAALVSRDGQRASSIFWLGLANAQQPGQTADLYYLEESQGIFLLAVILQQGTPTASLYVDANGKVQYL